jgi:Tfp pilus assembly protein PilO
MIAVIMISVFVAIFIYYGAIVENVDEKEQRRQERKKQMYYLRQQYKKQNNK